MAKFMESTSSIKKSVSNSSGKKKKKKDLTTQERINQKSYGTTKPKVKTVTNRTANTVTKKNTSAGGGNSTQQRYNNKPSGTATTQTRRTPTYSRNPRMQDTASGNNNADIRQRMNASRQRREQAQADSARRQKESEERRNKVATSMNPRIQDTARGTKIESENERRKRLEEARRQKNGDNSMASKSAQKAANRAVKNTPGVVKESAKQVGIGHGKTLADVTAANKSAAIGSKLDIKSKDFMEDIEKRRKKSTEVSRTAFKELSKAQEKSEAKMQKMTKDAKGLEKAYYGALESGTGMATDQLLGPAWAASMLSRTYGNTRGKAMKDGATEDEDRAYSLWQGAKEVATEYLFRGIGLSSKLSGAKSLAPSEKLANALTRNMRGPAADVTHAGIRLLGGTAEENAEEGIGWGLDPIISEFTYKKNVRTRQAQQLLREQSDQLRSNIRSDQDARAMASYLSSDDFIDSQIKTFRDNGVGEEEARELAESMRDYLDASLSGDTERMADIEETMSKRLAGKSLKDVMKDELSLSELMDTFASTTLLTATTGLPGTISTAARGAAVREQLGTDGIRALADMAIDFEDDDMSLKAEAMRDRMDSGKDITSTQAYDLMQGVQEQYEKDSDRQQASLDTAQKTIRNNKMVAPYEVERDGSISMDEVTAKNYRSTQREASDAIRTFVDNSEGQESLTDTQIDRGSRAIAGFQTGVFTVDDANELNYRNTAVRSAFEAETGIDLSEYVVTKDGKVDIPATNTATKNALFAMAADNLVKSAEAETANWIDNTKGEVVTQISRRMGGQGTLALQQALDDVDERDRSDYMMTANATDMLYQAARNMGTEWETAKSYATRMFPNIPEAKLKAMYDAGLADRDMATDTARGQQIELGEKIELKKDNDAPMGQVLVETEAPVKGTVIRTFSELASNLGVDIHLVDNLETGAGNQANGQYIKGNIYINVNSDFESNMGYIFMHEVTHHLRVFAPEQYQALENLVRDKWFNYDASQMQSEIAKKIETYAKHGQKLTEEQALEEIIADAAHEFLTDRNFAREVANEDASLAQAVLTSIRNALRMLRRIMSADNLDETHMNTLFSQLDILDEAERLWLDAYKQAVRNNAAVEVDRLQNQIYEEGRQSLSETSDSDYMDAINRGDTKAAQKMVDKAAKSAGFTVKGYHGTTNNFNTFKAGDIGFHFGKNKSTARTRVGRGKNAKIIPAWLSLDNPIKIDVDFGSWDADYRLAEYLRDEGVITQEEYQDALTVDNGTRRVKRSTKGANDSLRNILKDKGYDGIEYENYYEAEGATSYIVFDAAQIKNAEPVTYDDNGDVIPLSERFNQSNPDIRYSIGEEAREALNAEGIEELADGTTARYSLTSWQETNKEKKLKALTAANHDEKTAKKWIEDIDSIASIILGDPERLDYEADRSNKFLKPNGDYYKYTLDASTLCDKRRIYQGTYNAIQHAMPDIPLMQDDVVRIRTLLKEKDHKAPCGICYVESQRKNLGAYAKEWYDNYARKDEIRLEDVTTSDGLKELKKTNPEVAADFEKAMAAKGVSSPKVVKLRTDYREDIMRMRPSTIEYLNSIGGLRFHSFSDFETPHLIDTMQAVMDMATKNLMGMAYAKVPNFAAVFGPTGIKINLSLIAKTDENGNAVHDEDGRLVFDSVEGIPYEEAKKWRDAYPDNVAFILVGKDKEHTLEAINDDRVDFVIPFHRSKWSAEDMRRLGLVGYEDFATGHQENGIFVSEFWDYNKTGKENAERYLEVCKERGVTPIFEQLLHDNGDGTYSLQEDDSTDNYWKLLVEGKMYNHITKKGAPQQPVKPNFNMEEARRVLKEYEGGANELPVADDVVEAFVKEYKEAHPDAEIADARLSISADLDEPYMDAVNAGNMEEAQKYVDEAAKRAGMRVAHRYHGSMNANFTVFSKAHAKVGGNSGAGFYFSTSRDDSADHYTDSEGADNYFKLQAFADYLMEFETEWNGREIDSDETAMEIAREELNKNPGMFDVYLNYERPYIRNYKNSTNIYDELMEDFDDSDIDRDDYDDEDDYYDDLLVRKEEHLVSAIDKAVYGAISDLEDNYEILDDIDAYELTSKIIEYAVDEESLTWDTIQNAVFMSNTEVTVTNDNWFDSADATPELTRAIIENLGFDAIEDKEVSSKFGQLSREMQTDTEHIIVFKPEQIKLSDPVTYADDGSVIPLSERFDPTNNDIRYSMSTEDADGNVLTTNQMEFFKNSQARDAQGRLVRLFHSTYQGGFTIFDPSHSEDLRSLFFTNYREMSESYISEAETGDINPYEEQRKYRTIIDVDELPDGYDPKDIFSIEVRGKTDVYDGDDYFEAAKALARYAEADGWDLSDLSIDADEIYNDGPKAAIEAWNLFAISWEFDVEYQMSFGKEIEEGDEFAGTYTCYLNLENPMIIDGKGSMWHTINADGESHDTRGWAEIAYNSGYDGVIFRNIVDYGASGYAKIPADVYVAFSSNQVKDIRNQNPTENPDIRYSVTEDESKSRKDYKHAMSDDYELLEAYEETMLDMETEFADLSDENYYREYFGRMLEKYGKADKKACKTGKAVSVKSDNTADIIDAFYSALNEEVSMTYDDEILEEGRKTMAKSKQDFFSSVSQKWNDRWISGGEVLDVDSVKTDIKNLVTGIMANSDTDKQYKIDLVKRTQIDMRNAYQFLKQGREDAASALLYHSALRMIQNVEFVRDDTEYQEYQGIRDYLRGEPIYMSEDYWQDEKFLEFRKAHYGTLKLRKGKTNVDTVYGQLADLFPGVFSEAERERLDFKDDKSGMLQHIGYVTELNLEPFMAAYSSEECADWAFEIADDLYEIMVNGSAIESIADEYKARNEKALEKERARTEKAVRTAKAYKEKYDAQAKAMKTRHAEALLRIRKARDEGIKAEKQKFKEYKETQKENKLHSKYFDSISATHKTLRERLLTNTKDKHIPEVYKAQLAELLASFDLQTVASKKVEARRGRPGKKTIKMSALRTTLKNMAAKSELFYLNDTITDIMDELLGIKQGDAYSRSIDGLTLDELNASELKKIDRMLKALLHEFNNYESVRVGTKRQQAADIGAAQIDACLEHAEKYGNGKDYQTPFLAGINRVLNLDEVTPAYMFRQIDPKNQGIGLMFKELRRSFGKYVRNQNQINDWMEEILGEYQNHGKFANKYGADQIEQWRSVNNSKEFKLDSGQHIKLTPAQMMSILCLSNRQQAYDHMTGAGIVIRPVSFEAKLRSDIKDKANYATPYMLADTDIAMIKSQLTPDQVKVATKLQQLMATRMAEWGNEASMSVMGIRLFEDPDYFPIKSDKAALEKDFSADQFAEAIRNFGFTKAVQPGASNAIMVDDIFEVVAEHCNQMNLYNAYSESMNDFMRVYNYHKREDTATGYSDYSVEQAIAKAYSQKATTFIGTFIKDLNGNVSKDRTTGIDTLLNASLSNAKKASVFANGRVALQQPTALARAFYVIDPKYLKGFTMSKDTMKEMFEHSPIALWKSWGYYDINMGKSIEDLMMNNGSWLDDMMSDLYGQLDNRTWTAIWGMCKAEIEDLHPEVEKGSDEYWEMVSERMDEVVDLTQVVDSPFHRSHAMRSKDFFHKLTTSFMAEPTLTFNMVRDGLIRAHEAWKDGNKAEAGRIASRTILVFSLSGATTAAAAAIWDAVRGKGGDDDDEDKDLFGKMQAFFERWYDNFIENLQDNLFILNNIYYVKDVVSMFQGWDQRNLGFQGWKHLADAVGQLTGRKVNSKLTWYENFFAGVGYLSGLPIKTLISDTKSVFHLFGLQLPEPMQGYMDKLDSIGGGSAKSAKDVNSGASPASTAQKSQETSEGEKTKSSAVETHLWTYEDAPFHVEDGSLADRFLNHFGINLTSAEIAAAEQAKAEEERNEKIEDIRKKTEGLSGEAKDKKIWSAVTTYGKKQNNETPLSDMIQNGNYDYVNELRDMYIKAGGNADYFDERIYATSKTALKKTIHADATDSEIETQQRIKDYLLGHGMDEATMSDIVYKSYTAKDLKAAIMLNDSDAAVTELRALIQAGLTKEDFYRLWDNRNKGRAQFIRSYREKGKYKDRFKSTGVYNWPIRGQITSNFGHRSSPGGIGSTNHQGMDIAGSMGDPVGASDGGTVVYAGWYGGAGKTVMIEHDDGTITQYSHLSWWGVKKGDIVGQGQTIGNVGSTGNSTGPHLHFGVKVNGEYVDPSSYLNRNAS